MQQTELLIIGGGAAGLTAGLYGARAGRRTVLIERMFAGGQIATTHRLENYPGFPQGIGGVEIGMAMMEQAERFGLEIQYDTVKGCLLYTSHPEVEAGGGDYRHPDYPFYGGSHPGGSCHRNGCWAHRAAGDAAHGIFACRGIKKHWPGCAAHDRAGQAASRPGFGG